MDNKQKMIIASSIILILVVMVGFLYWQQQPKASGPITFTDALDRTVTIPKNDKILIVGKGNDLVSTALYMFPEAKTKIYGLSSAFKTSELFLLVDPNVNAKVIDGLTNPTVEAIVALQPDLVLLKSISKKTGDQLETANLKVAYVDLEGIDAYVRDLKILGAILGNPSRGEQLATYYTKVYSDTKKLADAYQSKPSALLLYYSSKSGVISFNTPGAGFVQNKLIDEAGGNSVTSTLTTSGWNIVGIEQIAAWNPDVIMVTTYSSSPSADDACKVLLADPTWQTLKAVQTKRVYAVPNDAEGSVMGSWDNPTSRWVLGYMWIRSILHPEDSTASSVKISTEGFYQEMYGLTSSQAKDISGRIQLP